MLETLHKLVRSLSAVEAKEGILPASLQNHTLLQRSKIRSYSWQPLKSSDKEDDVISLQKGLAHLHSVVDDSITSRNLFRSEAAWNCLVHTPLLKHTISEYDFLKLEPITSAGIAPSFRPLQRNDDASSHSRTSAAALSANKMVDFALVLEPKDELKTAIDELLDAQPIASGNIDAANCQLGVWVAAWHERMRSIIKMGDSQERVLTIPVIQVISSIWTILFVVDTGSDIRVFDANCRIGETDSIVGIYQLQAAIDALASWSQGTYEPWLSGLLKQANRVIASRSAEAV
ncbi:hypothetical protein DER44DRAFT_816463 [Fusarium oxysporum]|nr:hypothetical protein DER44DRAFT_816463 [Fusarium oxysporum]